MKYYASSLCVLVVGVIAVGCGGGSSGGNNSPPPPPPESYAVTESDLTATITVSRTGGSGGAVTVNYATSNGTATAGADYTANSGVLTWASGDTGDKTFSVTVVDDGQVEGSETVNLVLTNPTGGAVLGTANTAVLTITDAETVQFESATFREDENDGNAVITVSRSGGNGAVTVNYSTGGGTAVAGSDYTATSGTLTWAAGDTTDKTFSVPLIDDTLQEAEETVNLTLSNPTGGAGLGTQSTAILTITDDDQPGFFEFDSSTLQDDENAGTVAIRVRRRGGALGAVTVDFATGGGTAVAGTDYTATSGTLSWADGDTSNKTINLVITNDSAAEPDETVGLTLSNPTGGASLGTPNSTTLTITDDDGPGFVEFESSTFRQDENGTTAVITVQRRGGTAGAVTVDFTTGNGTAASGSDYTLASGTLTWAAGDGADKTFTVTLIDDTTQEGDETVSLTLSGPTGGVFLGTPSTATLTITDDESPGTIQFD